MVHRARKGSASGIAELWPSTQTDESVPLLKALHILTRDGGLNADSRRKLKQVLHLVQLLRPSVEALLEDGGDPVIADLGAGKSYLGFVLYDLILRPAGRGRIVGIEERDDLVEKSSALAADCGFTRMNFIASPI